MPIFNIGLSYPKHRNLIVRAVPLTRGDSSTLKLVIPRDAVIAGVFVHQSAATATAAATYNLGTAASPTGVLNAFSIAVTTPVGFVAAGATTGSLVGTRLTADTALIGTFNAGTSTGGAAVAYIAYFMLGAGEDPTD